MQRKHLFQLRVQNTDTAVSIMTSSTCMLDTKLLLKLVSSIEVSCS